MNEFLKEAIELSRQSIKEGGFPAGAIIVKDNQIIGRGISGSNNEISHAEISAIQDALKSLNSRDLSGCELYASMEPCLMCFSASYWAKIKKVVYACGKNKISKEYYEGLDNLEEINSKNNRKIEIIHIADLENDALYLVKDWEQKHK
jgi:tRNA(Arg) A34 adenosine deaminase TadA